MQLWKFSAAIVFLGSYLPLAAILLAQDIDIGATKQGFCTLSDILHSDCISPVKHFWFSAGSVILTSICFWITLLIVRVLPRKDRVMIYEAKHIPSDLFNYVVPYVVSFTSIDLNDSTKLIGLLIFMSWLFWITYKSGQIGMNPVLAVFRWRLYEVKYSFAGSQNILMGRMLSRVEISPLASYEMGYLQDIMVAR